MVLVPRHSWRVDTDHTDRLIEENQPVNIEYPQVENSSSEKGILVHKDSMVSCKCASFVDSSLYSLQNSSQTQARVTAPELIAEEEKVNLMVRFADCKIFV